ncbi:AMP-binding protein [Legionella gresilensis]|uniref:AMP-binding protein n=1 Tax=Legionella gresilensis TaxID=91823 RepID=UPI001041BCD6|nr:AMP-binding protein [Legionella gresilensis]
MQSLVDIIEENLQKNLYGNVYYLKDGEFEEVTAYTKIIEDAKHLATYFKNHFKPQSRIILLYPQGTAFISALLACFYARMVGVPTYPFQNAKHAYRLKRIISSCAPTLILGTHKTINDIKNLSEFKGYEFKSSDTILNEEISNGDFIIKTNLLEDDLAFLQYTSGSTGYPKGVMVSHKNLMHNLFSLKDSLQFSKEKTSVVWLPFQHDLGLIVGALSSLYNANKLVILPPVSVIQRPYVWLKALSDYQAYYTAGPNFAYQLCVDRIPDELLTTLNLSSVKYATAAAEPNRYTTAAAFCKKFARSGFKENAYCVGYGLAEGTLHVATNSIGKLFSYKEVSRSELGKSVIKEPVNDKDRQILMGAGVPHPEHRIVIVNAETQKRCKPYEIGEIWEQSQSVAQGYWDNEELTQSTFRAKLPGEKGYFLRTGDLGFMDGDQLFITGRLKDLIVINGRKIYPQDIELAVEECHPDIKNNCVAAFSIDRDNKECIVICAEVSRAAIGKDNTELVFQIRHAVGKKFEVDIADIKLIRPGHAYRTTSGKIKRSSTKEAYLNERLVCVPVSKEIKINKEEKKVQEQHFDGKDQLRKVLCDVLGISDIEENQHFMDLGGTSLHAKMLQQQLEECFGEKYQIPATIAFDYPTLSELNNYFGQLEKQT